MPLYEYQCPHCDGVSEFLMKISDPDPDTCDHCGKTGIKKKMSKTSFVLKGEGWYETDFKTKPKKAASGDSKKSESPSQPAASPTPAAATTPAKDK